ncbi:TonB-dependent receptor [soil metagenome]
MVKFTPASRLLIATILASGVWVGTADAQTAHSQPADEQASDSFMPDIVVTAQKRSESINTVPLTITAATGDQLKAAGVSAPSDLVRVVTGFQAVTSQVGAPVYYLRGVGFNDIAVASRPSVTLYSDEAPLPYSVMAMGTSLDLERVEVLKGPQGLLFGSNSTGGAINFIAAKPTDTLKAGFDGSYGRFNQYTVSGFVSGPLAEGIKARLAASHEGGDGWQYDFTDPSRKIGDKNITSVRGILQADPTENLSLQLIAQYTVDKSDTQQPQNAGYDTATALSAALAAFPRTPGNNRASSWNDTGPGGAPLARDNWQWSVTGRADLKLTDDLTLTSLTSFAKNHQETAIDGDGTTVQVSGYAVVGDLRSFSQELRLAGSIGDRLHFILGANYEKDKTRENQTYDISESGLNLGLAAALGETPSNNVPIKADTRFRSIGVFGNVDYDLTDNLTAHGGVRYTSTRTNFASCAQVGPGPGGGLFAHFVGVLLATGTGDFGLIPTYYGLTPGQCYSADDVNGTLLPGLFTDKLPEHNVSWKVGLDYKPMAGTMIYGSVSRGYKAGTYSPIGAAVQSQLLPVPQEKLTSYELGIKSDVVRNLLHVNAAYFYYDYANKQLQGTVIVLGSPIQRLVSIPKSRVQGFEFEATLRPTHGVTLGGTMTYIDSEVRSDFTDLSRFGIPANFKGAQFPDTPKWQAGANAELRIPFAGDKEFYVGGNLTYRSKAYGDFVKDERLVEKAYTVVDARVGINSQDGRWLAELFGRNIFDKYYWQSALRTSDAITRFTGMPATYGIRVSYRFD